MILFMKDLLVHIATQRVLFLTILLACTQGHAELSDMEREVLRTALSQKSTENDRNCAYTQTVSKPQELGSHVNETVVSRFDPGANLDSPWKLLAIDDRPPTDKELAKFKPQDRGHPVATRFNYPNIDELRVVSKDGDLWSFSGPGDGLSGISDGGVKDFDKRLNIVGSIHAPTATLKSLRTSLKKPFRSRVVAKFDKFDYSVELEFDQDVQKQVMRSMSMEMKMSVFAISQSVSLNVLYSDFECPSDLHEGD